MTEIAVRGLRVEYGEAVVLEQLNLTLPDHEFCVVMGPSGAGKTTFLRMLLSQEQPTRGEILIDGRPIDREPQPDRGVVFQRYSVFPHRTALENVMMGPQFRVAPVFGRLFGAARRMVLDRAKALLAEVGLGDALDKYPAQLSGGMQQRLAIAQALIMEPKVLLLDEPFGALDHATRAQMHELTLDLWERNRMTIVMVTHDIREAFLLGTRVIMIDKLRRDPQAPAAYGSTITHDLELDPALKPDLTDRDAADMDDPHSMRSVFEMWQRRMGPAVVNGHGVVCTATPARVAVAGRGK